MGRAKKPSVGVGAGGNWALRGAPVLVGGGVVSQMPLSDAISFAGP